VDDRSSDGTAEAVRALDAPVPLRVLQKAQGGPASARNAGVEAACGDIVLFLCDDIEATPGLLRLHDERRGGVTGDHCVVGRVDWPPDAVVTPFKRFVMERYHFGFEGFAGMDELPFHAFITANLSIHRELLLRVGGFDASYPYGFEDTDLGLRLAERGSRILYAPDALGWHHHQMDLSSYCRRQESIGPSAVAFSRRHPARPEVTRVDRVPDWISPRGVAKNLLLNPVTRPLWSGAVRIAYALGATGIAGLLCHQVLAYHYYRGVARAQALGP